MDISSHLLHIRRLFVLFAFLLFGSLTLLGVGVWFALPEVSGFLARSRANILYTLAYRVPLGSSTVIAGDIMPARSIPVLVYHGESDGSNMPRLKTFISHMLKLKENGWKTVTLQEFDEYMQGKRQLPDKSFLLTFDDGRKDTFYTTDPVLEDAGFTAVMFVITGASLPQDGLKSVYYLSPTELEYLDQSGRWELQSHGDRDHGVFAVQSTLDPSVDAKSVDGHFLSDKFWKNDAGRFETDEEFAARIEQDMRTAKQRLEDAFGKPIYAFAYPFNDFGQDSTNFPESTQILDATLPKVYRYGFYQTWPENGETFNYPDENNGPGSVPYMIKRIEPTNDWTAEELIIALEQGRAKELPFVAEHFGEEWVRTWGTRTLGDALILKATDTTTGASAFLNGSADWGDYKLSVTYEKSPDSSLSLMARNQTGEENYVCSFSERSVALQVHQDGALRRLAQAAYFGKSAGTVGMSVEGNTVRCFDGTRELLRGSYTLPEREKGGISIQIWNKELGTARAAISTLSVEPLTRSP